MADPTEYSPEWMNRVFDILAMGLDGLRKQATATAGGDDSQEWFNLAMSTARYLEMIDKTGLSFATHSADLVNVSDPAEELLKSIFGEGSHN